MENIMFEFRIINIADGNQIIDRSLKTPYKALTPLQMMKYIVTIRQYDKAIHLPFLSYDVQLLPVVTPHLLSKFIKQCINIMAIAHSSRTLCFKS